MSTLDRHRSRWNIPEVSYARDGTVLISESGVRRSGRSSSVSNSLQRGQGMVPLHRLPSDDFSPLASEGITVISPGDTVERRSIRSAPAGAGSRRGSSGTSYYDDSMRRQEGGGGGGHSSRRYKQKMDSKYALEKKGLSTGSWRAASMTALSTAGSVDKKAKRRKRLNSDPGVTLESSLSEGRHGVVEEYGSKSSKKRGRKQSARRTKSLDRNVRLYTSPKGGSKTANGGGESLSRNGSASLARSNRTRSVDGGRGSRGRSSKRRANDVISVTTSSRPALVTDKLSWMMFVVLGSALFVLGFVRLIVVLWHEYLCEIWTGVLVLVFGILNKIHKGQWLSTKKSLAVILWGAVANGACLVSVALILPVIIPTLKALISGDNALTIVTNVTFSAGTSSLAGVVLNWNVEVWFNLVLDILSLMLTCVSLFILTVTVMAISNYYDVTQHVTAQCDFRGKPKFFNPLELISLAQTCIFWGILTTNLQVMPTYSQYGSAIWSGVVVILAGLFAMFYGKQPHRKLLGIGATVVQLLALAACAVATVLTALSLVQDISSLTADRDTLSFRQFGDTIASAIAEVVFCCLMVVCIVFIIGILFRHFLRIACDNQSNST